MLKFFKCYTQHAITAILGNSLLFFIVIIHPGLLKKVLVYLESYSLETYMMFQITVELIFILLIIFFYSKIIRKKWLLFLSFFLVHFSIIYLINVAFFYFINPKGCLKLLFELYENNIFIVLRFLITFGSIFFLIRLTSKIPNKLIKVHYLILIPFVILILL